MAIGNVTPDSFYAASRLDGEQQIVAWARRSLSEGADILDIGGCSTRPNAPRASAEEEWQRVEPALRAIRAALPEATLSLDTFRPEIARRALEQFGTMIINDISGGCDEMYQLVSRWQVPYVLTLQKGENIETNTEVSRDLDLILDPGFGFLGGVEQDYARLRQLDRLRQYGRPILVGLSRKSMIWKPLGLTPETSLMPTQALQLYALEHGATILRTHDVAATRQTVQLFELINKS